ncbi:tyrosine-protein phosphatase [Lactiplantibacillus garii]|nr:tyrosine-protein phosphatase [Lactiplantibacillus garii]
MSRLFKPLAIILLAVGLLSGCTAEADPISGTYGQRINLKGASNTQDLGGIKTTSGQRIRSHRLIRSNQLAHLTKADVRTLTHRFHVTKVADLRSHDEIQTTPDVEMPGVTYYQDSVVADHQLPVTTKRYYQDLVATPIAVQGYATLFKQLLANHNGALLYHCTYGKDRTGVATMLILTALGVSKQTIVREYLRSNVNLAQGSRLTFKDPADPNQAFKRVTTGDLNAAYQEINHRYGSTTKFLRRLGVTSAKQQTLRRMYLTAK